MANKTTLWSLCVAGTLIAVAAAGIRMVAGGERELLLIGRTSDAHHQIEMACETCHAAPPFANSAAAAKALNETCRHCHEDELLAADDSHPRKLFRAPRMAAYRQQLDILQCTTCHAEHRPEITRTGGVTVATDFCAACHSLGDQDVRAARPSHAGLAFDTCASAGCHNYHDNRALYEDFLTTHADNPWVAPKPEHRLSALRRDANGEAAATSASAVAPLAALKPSVVEDWTGTAHATMAVSCPACHAPDVAADASAAALAAQWIAAPDATTCIDCHDYQAATFAGGRHGMRQHPAIAEPRDSRQRLDAVGLGLVPDAVAKWIADPPRPTRMTYTRKVVQRLAKDEEVIAASEHYEDDSALPLPAQMFRFGAELVADETEDFSYSLLSLHPINKKNGPGTAAEQDGLEHVADRPGENYYGEEELGGQRYFVAIYPDYAVAEACVNCHNNHKDSPRTDAKIGDVMGGVVIRFPISDSR